MSDYDPDFEALWAVYPKRNGRKTKKKPAYVKWQKLTSGEKAALKAAVDKHNRNHTWGKYIRDLLTFINQAGWEDDVDLPQQEVQRSYQPIEDPFLGTRWTARANRRLLDYMMHRRGIPEESIAEAVREKNRVADEFGRAFEEDLMVDSSREARNTIAEDFDRAVYMAIERVTGTAFVERLLRARR